MHPQTGGTIKSSSPSQEREILSLSPTPTLQPQGTERFERERSERGKIALGGYLSDSKQREGQRRNLDAELRQGHTAEGYERKHLVDVMRCETWHPLGERTPLSAPPHPSGRNVPTGNPPFLPSPRKRSGA